MSEDIHKLLASLETYINERVAQHQESLRIYSSAKIQAELRACIAELERLRTFLIQSDFARKGEGRKP